MHFSTNAQLFIHSLLRHAITLSTIAPATLTKVSPSQGDPDDS